MDQGYFSPSLTPAQLSVYMPQLGGVRSELSRMMMAGGKGAWVPKRARWVPSARARRDGFHGGLPHRVAARALEAMVCPEGTQPVTDSDAGGSTCGIPGNADSCPPGTVSITDSTGMSACICPSGLNITIDPTSGAPICTAPPLPGPTPIPIPLPGPTPIPAPLPSPTPTPLPPWRPGCLGCEFCPHNSVFNPITGTVLADGLLVNQYWDPSAVVEAQALADIGSYEDAHPATLRSFEAAVNTARDADTAAYSMTDAQLDGIMSGGYA